MKNVCETTALPTTTTTTPTPPCHHKHQRVAFIPFLCAGDPDLPTTAAALRRLDALGADVIELGVPYSDPLADGAVIHSAATRALMQGTTLDAVIDMVRGVAPGLNAPLVLFTYFNPILRKGLDKFCAAIKEAGASGAPRVCVCVCVCRRKGGARERERGVAGQFAFACAACTTQLMPNRTPLCQHTTKHKHINNQQQPKSPGLLVPDIPLEETPAVRAACERAGLELVLLVTPTTPKQRMADIARASQGFVYLVSVTGVTGVQERVQARVEGLIDLLHSVTDKSVAVGFGVSRPEQARQIVEWGAEGVICGSALVRALGEAKSPEEGLDAMEALAKSLRDAIPH